MLSSSHWREGVIDKTQQNLKSAVFPFGSIPH